MTEDERNFIKNLPNFDAVVFKEITGIDLLEKKTIVIDGKEIKVSLEIYDKMKEMI